MKTSPKTSGKKPPRCRKLETHEGPAAPPIPHCTVQTILLQTILSRQSPLPKHGVWLGHKCSGKGFHDGQPIKFDEKSSFQGQGSDEDAWMFSTIIVSLNLPIPDSRDEI